MQKNWQHGTIEAPNKHIARFMLSQQQWQHIRLHYIKAHSNSLKPLSAAKFSQLCQQLSHLLKAGIDLNKSLQLIIENQKNTHVRANLTALHAHLQQGNTLHSAVQLSQCTDKTLYLKLIEVGEQSGCLDDMLGKIHFYLNRKLESIKKLRRALSYPALIVTSALVIVTFLFIMVIPQFASLFASVDTPLPYLTQLIIHSAEHLKNHLAQYVMCAAAIPTGLALAYKKIPPFTHLCQRTLLRLPWLGALCKDMLAAKFSHTLGTLLKAGLPLSHSLQILTTLSSIKQYQQACRELLTHIEQGQPLAHSMRQQHIWPATLTQIMHSGENSGNLDDLLLQLALQYDQQINHTLEHINTLLEPFFMLFLGTIVAFIVIAMYLPILQMGSVF